MNRNSVVPDIIKLAAVTAALPRWTLALLAADGFVIPASWGWVHAVSAMFGAAMCILEGVAIAYVLAAFTSASGKQSSILAGLTSLVFVSFAGVLAPSIYSRVVGLPVGAILPAWALWSWALCVALTTILTVAAVGYAQAIITASGQWRNAATAWQNKANELAGQVAHLEAQRQIDATPAANVAPTPATSATSNDKPVARDVFITTYRNNGHTSVASLARELGVDIRSAQRWIKSERVS
jgi:hypothetical protein